MIFVYQTVQVLASSTAHFLFACTSLRYPHKVRRNNSQHCLLLFIRENSKLSRFDIGLSRAPAPTPKFYRCKIAQLGAEGVTLVCYANSSFLIFSHRIPIPVQQFYDLIIIKSLYSMIVCTLRIGINSHGTSMAYLLKRILHDSYH